MLGERALKAFSTLFGEFALDLSDFAFIINDLYYSSGFDPPPVNKNVNI